MSSDQSFILNTPFAPAGDQPQAIEALCAGLKQGARHQTLLGVTGSGKTFTIANVIAKYNRPTLILAHNKTLAAQLYGEMKTFFPHNAVEYFVSYYDYYQPEAYIPSSDTFIEKDSAINAHIDQLRLSATKALLQRSDVIVVGSVSAIYGLGDPGVYHEMSVSLTVGTQVDQRSLLRSLVRLQYKRNQMALQRGQFRLRGDILDIYPADLEQRIVRLEFFEETLERIALIDITTGACLASLSDYKLCPKTHYVTTEHLIQNAIEQVRGELAECRKKFLLENKLLEEQRITQRTLLDLEMLTELGYCNGIENYSRYLSGRNAGDPPPTLLEYLPEESLLILDESHVMIPQLKAMYHGDRMRKKTLVQYGFRLPSAFDNRPLTFEEFEQTPSPIIFLSATPGRYEYAQCGDRVIAQVIRPTGLLDPVIEIRPVRNQIPDLLSEIHQRVAVDARVFVTTLTKRMAEDLTRYLSDHGVRARYLHSEIDTIERIEILRDLRQGVFDVLVGINLLREGLDLPEVSLVAILDADKEGFLRSESALIQTMGRAARHVEGKAILYADQVTSAMAAAIEKTQTRRALQAAYNARHHITPSPIKKEMLRSLQEEVSTPEVVLTPQARAEQIEALQEKMRQHAENLEFEIAKNLRDQIKRLKSVS